MNDGIIVISAFATVAAIIFGIPKLISYHVRRQGKRLYSSIQIGDKYIHKLLQSNPYKPQWGDVITIQDKRMSEGGIPYVKFRREGSPFDESENLFHLIDLYHYEPYNNQDKEQQ